MQNVIIEQNSNRLLNKYMLASMSTSIASLSPIHMVMLIGADAKGNIDDVKNITHQSIIVAIMLSAPTMSALYLASRILSALSQDAKIVLIVNAYGKVMCLAVPPRLPISVCTLSENEAYISIMRVIPGWLGTNQLLLSQILKQYIKLYSIFIDGLTHGMQVAVSKATGLKDYESMRRREYLGIILIVLENIVQILIFTTSNKELAEFMLTKNDCQEISNVTAQTFISRGFSSF